MRGWMLATRKIGQLANVCGDDGGSVDKACIGAGQIRRCCVGSRMLRKAA